MKTFFTSLAALLFIVSLNSACKKESDNPPVSEDELAIRTAGEDASVIESNGGFKSAFSVGICCGPVPGNIVRDPDFLGIAPGHLYGVAPCNNLKSNTMTGYNTDWFAAPYGNTPQAGVINCSSLALAMGACDKGYIHFWGNRQYGESITQDNTGFTQNRWYKIRFNARIRPGNVGNTRLAVRLSNVIPTTNIRTAVGPNYSNTFVSPVVIDTAWRCYDFAFVDSLNNRTVLNLFPVNQFSGAANFSRLDIDNVKIW
jgi:hypothetical protein